MIVNEDTKLIHEMFIDREILPNNYELFRTNKIKLPTDYFGNSRLKSTENISTFQENQFIYTNPNKNKKVGQKYKFKFNLIINIDKNMLMDYFSSKKYQKLFDLLELYIVYLFNGIKLEEISNLFKKELITDAIYVNFMKCALLIKKNKKLYKQIYLRNTNNILDSTEIISKFEEYKDKKEKDDALFLLEKFIDLLKSIDENLYGKEIEKLNEVINGNLKSI